PGAVVRGHWCPVCSRDASKLGLDLMKNIALERGGTCVSPSYHDGTIAGPIRDFVGEAYHEV
ncbi:hypothetical protein A8F74_01615, partial [Burkholderia cenocepacia]